MTSAIHDINFSLFIGNLRSNLDEFGNGLEDEPVSSKYNMVMGYLPKYLDMMMSNQVLYNYIINSYPTLEEDNIVYHINCELYRNPSVDYILFKVRVS